MHYEHPERMIRPPSEGRNILLQATVGCSHNKCTFCGAYKGIRFKIKSDDIIDADIKWAAKNCRDQRRLFLCDGDALIIPQKRLVRMLENIREELPWLDRVGAYANAKSVHLKSADELAELRALGLKMLYFGLESGDDVTLKRVNKGVDSARMIETGRKIKDADMKIFITVLNGLGGRERSLVHARETGRVLSAIDPEYVGALSLMLVPGTPLYEEYRRGEFEELGPEEILRELREMIACTEMTRGLFYANHASNYLPLRVKMPGEKDKNLELIDQALAGMVKLKPERYRRF